MEVTWPVLPSDFLLPGIWRPRDSASVLSNSRVAVSSIEWSLGAVIHHKIFNPHSYCSFSRAPGRTVLPTLNFWDPFPQRWVQEMYMYPGLVKMPLSLWCDRSVICWSYSWLAAGVRVCTCIVDWRRGLVELRFGVSGGFSIRFSVNPCVTSAKGCRAWARVDGMDWWNHWMSTRLLIPEDSERLVFFPRANFNIAELTFFQINSFFFPYTLITPACFLLENLPGRMLHEILIFGFALANFRWRRPFDWSVPVHAF